MVSLTCGPITVNIKTWQAEGNRLTDPEEDRLRAGAVRQAEQRLGGKLGQK